MERWEKNPNPNPKKGNNEWTKWGKEKKEGKTMERRNILKLVKTEGKNEGIIRGADQYF